MEEERNSEEEKKFDNEVKKIKMELETGAVFFKSDNSDIPADIEAQFLDNIMAFEKASKNPITKTVGEILNHPQLVPEKELTDQQVHEALAQFFKLMEENNMALDIIYKTPDRELYKFISTEFLAVESEMLSFPGMTSHFIYEEFVPNHLEDLRKKSKTIVTTIFNKNFGFIDIDLLDEMKFKGKAIPKEKFIKILEAMHDNRKLELIYFEVTDIKVDDNCESATVKGKIKYSSKFTNEKETSTTDEATIHFVNKYDFWCAEQVLIPGLGL